jgi:hypothetical protein
MRRPGGGRGQGGRVQVRRRVVRGAEVRLFFAARAYAATVAARDRSAGAAVEPELPKFLAALSALESAARGFSEVSPASRRRRRRRGRS